MTPQTAVVPGGCVVVRPGETSDALSLIRPTTALKFRRGVDKPQAHPPKDCAVVHSGKTPDALRLSGLQLR